MKNKSLKLGDYAVITEGIYKNTAGKVVHITSNGRLITLCCEPVYPNSILADFRSMKKFFQEIILSCLYRNYNK